MVGEGDTEINKLILNFPVRSARCNMEMGLPLKSLYNDCLHCLLSFCGLWRNSIASSSLMKKKYICVIIFFHILVCFTSTLSDPVYFFIAHGSHFQGGKSIQNDRQAPNRIVLVIIFKSIRMAKLRPRLFQLADFDISCVNASLFPLPNYFILDAHIHFPFLGVKQSLINMNTTIAQIWNAQIKSLFGWPNE